MGRLPDAAALYSDVGLLPRDLRFDLSAGHWLVSLHLLSGAWPAQAALLILGAWFGLRLMAGWKTRTSTLAAWLLLASLHTRNPLVLHSGDLLLRMALLWGVFLPWGACWSFDSLRRPAKPGSTFVATAGTAVFLGQVTLVYLAAAADKVGPEWRTEGTAVYYALNLDHFSTALGHALLGVPQLLEPLTHAVFWLQACGPLLLFSPVATAAVRSVIVPAFWTMQAGFGLSLALGLFPWTASAVMLAFIPGRWWDHVAERRRARPLAGTTAAHRWLMKRVGVATPSRPPEAASDMRLSRAMRALLLGLAAFAFALNISELPGSPIRLPAGLKSISRIFALEQNWAMFAPGPPSGDGWFVLPGWLRNGRTVDLLTGGPLSWEKPAVASQRYPNMSWRVYLHRLMFPQHKKLIPRLVWYLCRTWNGRHAGVDTLEEVGIVFVSEPTPPPGAPFAAPTPVWLFRQTCASSLYVRKTN